MEENHYNTYQSQKYSGWYVGIKKNGKTKDGSRTHIGQKAIFFLPRKVDNIPEWKLNVALQWNEKKKKTCECWKTCC